MIDPSMKKLITTLLILILSVPAAFSQQIRDIDETVVLHRDGSARVTQVWDVEAVDGTEFYLPFDHLGPLDITDLLVSEGGVPFVPEGDGWETGRTREAKRGRCGVVRKSDGVELCWGIGEYGDHVWTVSYTVKGLVMQLDSCAALYFSFVNPGLMSPPQHVKVVLVNETGGPAWTPDNVKVWGFGSDSESFVEDGAIRAESLSAFGSDDRVTALVRSVGLIDIAIPRGGERLIRAMCEAALIPVLKHYNGICHVYVDDRADLGMALSILDNAKTQRPGTCNAAECLLVQKDLAPLFLPMVKAWAADKGVTLHEGDVGVEYLSLDLNVATVKDVDAAIAFINEHGSHHSDCIVTNDKARAETFLHNVDSAAVYWNASTRFTDGAEFGMGAEIGISTDKLHARGPMGLEELTTYKYTVTGDGALRK